MSSETIAHQLNVGDVSGGNYLKIEEDGSLIAQGDAAMWEDLRFPASSLNPPGAASDADVDNSTTFLGTLLFDAGSTEICAGQAQMPHSRQAGSNLRCHIHWAPTTNLAGNVLWRLEYQIANRGAVFPASYTTLNILSGSTSTLNAHITAEFTEIDGSNIGLSSMMIWKLSRIGGDGTDTYAADARLLEFDIHYVVDSLGSKTEHTK